MGREEEKLEFRKRLENSLMLDLASLLPFFDVKTVTNVYVYGNGNVQVDDFEKGIFDPGLRIGEAERMRIINGVSSVSDTLIDRWERPTLEAIIPGYNIRTTAILPPWTESPELSFRRPADRIFTLEEYLEQGRMSKEFFDTVVSCIERRGNIVVSGSTGSGKTTFTNACIQKMVDLAPDDRFYIVEDTPELQCRGKNKTQLYIRKEQAVTAIQTALRWTPKRIIFGEIRSGEVAVELLEAWNTGHPGNITTVHADSAKSTVSRIEGLLRQKIQGALPDLRDTVDLIVHLSGKKGFGPAVDEVADIDSVLNGA
jgi:type IV secretion system protein VirB11